MLRTSKPRPKALNIRSKPAASLKRRPSTNELLQQLVIQFLPEVKNSASNTPSNEEIFKAQTQQFKYLKKMLPPKPGLELKKVDLRLIQPIFYSNPVHETNQPVDPVIRELHGELERLNIIRGITGSGKTAAVLNVAKDRFLIYLECSGSVPTDFYDINYRTLVDDISTALMAHSHNSNLTDHQRRNTDFNYAQFRCRLEWTARLFYLYLLLLHDPNITPQQYLLLQIDGGQSVIRKIIYHFKEIFTIKKDISELLQVIHEHITKILQSRDYKHDLIFFVDELNESIHAFQEELYFSSISNTHLTKKDQSGLGTILSLHALDRLDWIHIVVSGTTISNYSKLVGSAGSKPISIKYLSGTRLPITRPEDIKSFLNEYIDMSESKICDGLYRFLRGRLRILMFFLYNCVTSTKDPDESLDSILTKAKEAAIQNMRNRVSIRLEAKFGKFMDFLLALSICGLWGINIAVRQRDVNSIFPDKHERFDPFQFDPVIVKPHDLNSRDTFFSVEEPVYLVALSQALIEETQYQDIENIIEKNITYYIYATENKLKPFDYIVGKYLSERFQSTKSVPQFLCGLDNNNKHNISDYDWANGYTVSNESSCGTAQTLGYIKHMKSISKVILNNKQYYEDSKITTIEKINKLKNDVKDKSNPLMLFFANMQNNEISEANWCQIFSILIKISEITKLRYKNNENMEAAAILLFMLLRPPNTVLNPFHHLGPNAMVYLSRKNNDKSISILPVYVNLSVTNHQDKKINSQFDSLHPNTFFDTRQIKENLESNSIWVKHFEITRDINALWANMQKDTHYLSLSVVLTLDHLLKLENNIYNGHSQTERHANANNLAEKPIHHILRSDNIYLFSKELSILFKYAETYFGRHL